MGDDAPELTRSGCNPLTSGKSINPRFNSYDRHFPNAIALKAPASFSARSNLPASSIRIRSLTAVSLLPTNSAGSDPANLLVINRTRFSDYIVSVVGGFASHGAYISLTINMSREMKVGAVSGRITDSYGWVTAPMTPKRCLSSVRTVYEFFLWSTNIGRSTQGRAEHPYLPLVAKIGNF